MLKFKKKMVFLLVVCMLLALCSGCGNDSSEDITNSSVSTSSDILGSDTTEDSVVKEDSEETANSSVLPITEEITEISVFGNDRPFLWEYIDEYSDNYVQAELEERTNIKVNYVWFSEVATLMVNIASG